MEQKDKMVKTGDTARKIEEKENEFRKNLRKEKRQHRLEQLEELGEQGYKWTEIQK